MLLLPRKLLIVVIFLVQWTAAKIEVSLKHNLSDMAIGLSEIARGIQTTTTITLLNLNRENSAKINEFIQQVHKFNLKTCVFDDTELFYGFVSDNLKGSLEVTSLIFAEPYEILEEIHAKNLAHRLVLFMFYWDAVYLPNYEQWNLHEPLRTVFITNPRKNVYRVYYNQASAANDNKLTLVNWYNGNDLGLHTEPLLKNVSSKSVYKDFNGRILSAPVIHSPPWFFVTYKNDSSQGLNDTSDMLSDDDDDDTMADELESNSSQIEFQVTGRDDTLLKLLSQKMNFVIKYKDPPERTQGVAQGKSGNFTFTGGLGMLQRRESDLFLGDVVISYERMQEVEFSFFTLADSGAFVTHSPRRLSETLALIRPFSWHVWIALFITIIISGPALFLIVIMPMRIRNRIIKKRFAKPKTFHHMIYVREITRNARIKCNPARKQLRYTNDEPSNMLHQCIWFTVNVYLKQFFWGIRCQIISVSMELFAAAEPPHNGNRARFLVMILWLSATYVLSDLYSAELTSQLARPAKETPINKLHRLLKVVENDPRYKLLAEPESASLEALKNGTGVMRKLYKIMTSQGDNSTYFASSLEESIQQIAYGDLNVVFGGRETLFFNTKKFGTSNFQLSEKLYTRYSAISLQKGCLFLDSLNENIMRLFEGGVLEKITNDEYEKMYKKIQYVIEKNDESTAVNAGKKETSKSEESSARKAKNDSNTDLQPISLTMLKGAFFVLLLGYILAAILLSVEIEMSKPPRKIAILIKNCLTKNRKIIKRFSYKFMKRLYDGLFEFLRI